MIVSTQHNLSFEQAILGAEEAYGMTVRVIEKLARIHPTLTTWYDLPRSEKDSGTRFDDRDKVLERLQSDIDKQVKEYPDWDQAEGVTLNLATGIGKDWRKAGRADLTIDPVGGRGVFRLRQPDKAYGDATTDILRSALIAMVEELSAEFANNDIKVKTAQGQLVAYQFNRRLYQHRKFFGWMGFVPVELVHEQIRDAHAVHPIKGKGTVIVSVPGIFNPADDAQVEKAHRVEMDLASYDLLPVTDPKLKD